MEPDDVAGRRDELRTAGYLFECEARRNVHRCREGLALRQLRVGPQNQPFLVPGQVLHADPALRDVAVDGQ